MSPHLSEDQLTDTVLEGAPPPECQPHLRECSSCRERVERELLAFGASMEDFNRVSLAWSSARHPNQTRPARATSRPFALRFAPAALAFAALAFAAALPLWQHEHHPIATASSPAPDSPSDIAADNALMQSVNVALAANEPSPFQEFHLPDEPGPAHGNPRNR